MKQLDIARIQEKLDDAWLNLPDIYYEQNHYNPFEDLPPQLVNEPHLYYLWLLSNPDYFPLFCKEILNFEIYPFQAVILKELWYRKLPILIGSRGLSKSLSLAIYCILRCVFIPGRKIVLTGAGFRQSKVIFDYIEKIWNGAPLLRDLIGSNPANGPHKSQDMWKFQIGDSVIVALPIGPDGGKIRGQRAHDIIVDEFAVGNAEVFEHVVSGFAIVKSDPVNVSKTLATQRKAKELGFKLKNETVTLYEANQIVLAGTAYHRYNHFYKYFKRYHDIICTNGDKKKLEEIGEDKVNPENYGIIRIPYDLIPEGLFDQELIERSRSSMHSSLFLQEFGACFSDDTNGFFKRSLIERCVSDHSVLSFGERGKEYVIAVDPASEADNFCVVVLEVTKSVRKVVYCWTTTKKSYKEELKSKRTSVDDFYDYAALKIIRLANDFNTIGIAIDTQGGGHAIISSLHKSSLINQAEGGQKFWPFIDPEKPKDEDGEPGRHIIELVNFADFEYTSNANHNLRHDFETKSVLFPSFDGLTFAEIDLTSDLDIMKGDIIEECVLEIEEMKNELSSIVQTQTPSGRDRWDTPDNKAPGMKKGRLRKDRYSALLMANALARKLQQEQKVFVQSMGGFVNPNAPKKFGEGMGTKFNSCKPGGALLATQLNKLYGNYHG